MATNINLNLDLDSLSDVDLTGQAVGFALVYDGTKWVPTDTVFLDEANKRLGIGTDTPNDVIHVLKTGVQTRLRLETTDTNVNAIDLINTDNWWLIQNNNGFFIIRDNTGGGGNSFVIQKGTPANSFSLFNSQLVINQNANDYDFRVEGQSDPNLIFTDAANDRVGIGTVTPDEKLEVNGKIKATDINSTGLPTSSVGLSSGDVWNDGGTLKIV